ncbi:hypothetical protein AGMMS4952_04040 [Spirochaetia bacterium]|nr:hypothetical protein AGMMS4952_04040 [Spirochaetia bacterium]
MVNRRLLPGMFLLIAIFAHPQTTTGELLGMMGETLDETLSTIYRDEFLGMLDEPLDETLSVLYRMEFDEDFYAIAESAGAYIWGTGTPLIAGKDLWYLSLEAALSTRPHIAGASRIDSGIFPQYRAGGSSATALEVAAQAGIPVFLDLRISGSIARPFVVVDYGFQDLFNAAHEQTGHFEVEIPTEQALFSWFWLNLAAELNTFMAELIKPPLEIYGQPGTRIVIAGLTTAPLTIPPSGALLIDVPIPLTLSWEAVHPRYVTTWGVYLTTQEAHRLELEQRRHYQLSVDLALTQAVFPDFWLSYSRRSYGWRFSLGLQQQTFGIGLQDNDTPLETSFNARPLVMPGFQAAYRLKADLFHPQLSLAAALSLRFKASRCRTENPFDDFSPLGFSLSAGYDWEMPTKYHFTLFAEVGASLYILRPGYSDSFSKGTRDAMFFQQLLGDAVYVELPLIRFGFRFPLPLPF